VARRALVLFAALASVAVIAASGSAGAKTYTWHDTPTGTTAHLRGVAAISSTTAWASGYVGTVLRTVDGGATWQQVGPPGTQNLQFRDIEAFDADHAVIMSVGANPSDFRIYVTADGGQHWALTFVNAEPAAFYDCMTFFDKKRGLALSDPPDGQKFRMIATGDGGYSWHVVDPAGMPPALPGEAGFAASGECITSDHGHRAWFGTGGSAVARVFRSDDRGQTWTVVPTPMPAGPTSGINGLAFRGEQHGIAVGGDFFAPTASPKPKVWSRDGGSTWNLAATPQEYRSGVAWVDGHTAVAVGISGSDVSYDGGVTWTKFDGTSLDTVDCANPNACWAAGAGGRVAYLVRTH
jgi:photosystem II stability/assembly factor-like uncharacterized protein